MVSNERSISSAVQKDALVFLYIFRMLLCSMGKRTNGLDFLEGLAQEERGVGFSSFWRCKVFGGRGGRL